VVAAAVCTALVARGERVAAFKPAVTGLDEAEAEAGGSAACAGLPHTDWPRDHELLAAAAGGWQAPEEVAPYRFGPPLSPHYAAELAGETIEPARLLTAARTDRLLVAEGVGGLMVPITPGYLMRDLAVDLGLPVLIAARTGLGTINHTLLTIEAARGAGLRVAGVVMTPWPDQPEPIELSNRATVEGLSGVTVSGLPPTDPASLAAAGAQLPIDDWLVGPLTA
jgi:dethiobiotin synthetase